MYLIIAIIPKQLQSSESKHTTKTTLSRPTPRSGWRVSLRRDVLAQASPLRLGEGSKKETRANAGSRLGETPLAWARYSLAQKNWAGRLSDLSLTKGLGESLFISPRQDWLAWAWLACLATVFLQQLPTPVQTKNIHTFTAITASHQPHNFKITVAW